MQGKMSPYYFSRIFRRIQSLFIYSIILIRLQQSTLEQNFISSFLLTAVKGYKYERLLQTRQSASAKYTQTHIMLKQSNVVRARTHLQINYIVDNNKSHRKTTICFYNIDILNFGGKRYSSMRSNFFLTESFKFQFFTYI